MTLITGIDESNFTYYQPLFPPYLLDEVMEDERILVFGIEADDAAAGSVAVRFFKKEAEIIWFYMDPSFRGIRHGRNAFWDLLEQLRFRYGIMSVSLTVPAGSKDLEVLFTGMDVIRETLPQGRFETTLGRLKGSERLQGTAKHSVALSDVEASAISVFTDKLKKEGLDYLPLPLEPSDYLEEQSAVYREDGKVAGLLLVRKRENTAEIAYMASLSPKPSAVKDMIAFVLGKAEQFPGDLVVTMELSDDKLVSFVKSVTGVEDEEGFTYSERITIPLDFFDEAEKETDRLLEFWKSMAA